MLEKIIASIILIIAMAPTSYVLILDYKAKAARKAQEEKLEQEGRT